MLINLSCAVAAYLLGSLSSAIIVCRMFGLPDPRSEGSKNPGTTNVVRLGGKKPAIITLLGDSLKGFVPVAVGLWYGVDTVALSLLAGGAILGHMFPLFFGFAGGKGIATAFGVLLGVHWTLGLAALATWLAIAVATRYSSLAAIVTTMLVPVYVVFLTPQYSPIFAVSMGAISLLIIWRHKANIQKLLAGNESKIGEKSS